MCALSLIGCAGPREAVLTTYDQVCLPGEPIELRAQLESGGWIRSDIEKEKIAFYRNGEKLGEALTADEGMAKIPYLADGDGFFQFEARLESEKYFSKTSPLLVRVAPPETKFLVVDIDNTLSDLSPILMIFYENANIPPLKGAPETLQELSREYTIVYLTGRDEVLSPKTKRWLAENRFPPGPVFFWDFTHTPTSKRKYKSEAIQTLGRKFQLIQIGIGNSVGDAFAYLTNGLQSFILIGDSKKERRKARKLPRGTQVVRSWSDIQKLL